MKKLGILLSICITSFALYSAQNESSPTIIVVSAGKSWRSGGKGLTRGQTLDRDMQLLRSGEDGPELILDCGSAGWLSYICKGNSKCTVRPCETQNKDSVAVSRVDYPTGGATSPSESNWLFALLFKRERNTVAVLGVREGGQLSDAVVQKIGNEVALGPALNRVLEGKYCIRFSGLPPDAAISKQATLEWDRAMDVTGKITLPDLHAGLYSVQKATEESPGACQFETEAAPSWVLVATSADFSQINSQWRQVSARFRQLELEGNSPAVLLTVRHATLAQFAESLTDRN